MIEESLYADVVAIPLFAFLVWYVLDKGINNWKDSIVLAFGIGGLVVDSYIVYSKGMNR